VPQLGRLRGLQFEDLGCGGDAVPVQLVLRTLGLHLLLRHVAVRMRFVPPRVLVELLPLAQRAHRGLACCQLLLRFELQALRQRLVRGLLQFLHERRLHVRLHLRHVRLGRVVRGDGLALAGLRSESVVFEHIRLRLGREDSVTLGVRLQPVVAGGEVLEATDPASLQPRRSRPQAAR
jgi:hypothetical protein